MNVHLEGNWNFLPEETNKEKIERAFNNFQQWSLGYDRIFGAMLDTQKMDSQNYPPHNLIKESENKYRLELAVAGFKKEDVKIIQKELELTISGNNSNKDKEEDILHKGIANRSFSKAFYLSERIEVIEASFEDGMIIIQLEDVIPESEKPKFIEFK